MVKPSPYARFKYDRIYRFMRLYGEEFYQHNKFNSLNDAEDCALMSYDYRQDCFSGWVNDPNKFKFRNLMAERFPRIWFNLR